MQGKWFWIDTTVLLALGLIGGTAAQRLGLPLPYMLGSLTLSAIYTLGWGQTGREVQFFKPLRYYFIAAIGTMIGSRFTPDLIGLAAQLWPSFLGILVFVMVAHTFGYVVLRKLGGYDRATATYAALPGGLIEATTLGEQAGGDVRLLTLHHFARIFFVVVSVPLLFLWLGGEAVGSSSGQTIDSRPSGWIDLALIAVIALAGLGVGRLLRLPAGQLMGPLILCAAAHVAGLIDLHSPGWLLSLAQLVVGAALGAQFAGVTGRLLMRTFALGAVTIGGMLLIGASMAAVLAQVVPGGFPALFISFAPGGVTEMALIALSLEASPVIVTAHHLVRILFAVLAVGGMARLLRKLG